MPSLNYKFCTVKKLFWLVYKHLINPYDGSSIVWISILYFMNVQNLNNGMAKKDKKIKRAKNQTKTKRASFRTKAEHMRK